MTLTKSQRRAIRRVYDRNHDGARSYLEFRRRVVPAVLMDCILLHWQGMVLGIERDGHTHS